jgi:hypothetical protein
VRRFAYPVTIGVYVTSNAFMAANGIGTPGTVGTTFLGRVTLSPVSFSAQRQRMPSILTHELSHAHLQSWMSQLAYMSPPHWFQEGLAVMVSEGGGAEGVSEPQTVKFENPPTIPDSSFRTRMAYRQAELFVAFLHDSNPVGFEHMMDGILQGSPFAETLTEAYASDLPTLWLRFVQAIEQERNGWIGTFTGASAGVCR